MFLALTSNEEFWDKGRRMVFLGEHCKLHERADRWKGLGAETLGNPWDGAEKVTAGARCCLEIQERALDCLTGELNRLHGLDKDKRYYRVLLGHWLAHFLNNIYDKHLRLRGAFEGREGLETWILDESQWVVPGDYREYIRLFYEDKEDRGDLQLCSQIMALSGRDCERRRLSDPNRQSLRYKSESSPLSVFAARVSGFLSGVFHGGGTVTVTGCPAGAWNLAGLVLRSGFMCVCDDMKYHVDAGMTEPDRGFRGRPLALGGGEFEELAARMIPANMPWLFVEGFREFREKVGKLPIKESAAYFSVAALNSNNVYRLAVAERLPRAKMLIMQHGGGYGVDLLNLHETHETAVADTFYTGGWAKSEKTRPLSLAKLARNRSRIRRDGGGEGVLVGISASGRWTYRLDNTPWAENYLRTNVEGTVGFLERLFDASKALVRIYPPDNKNGLGTGERIKERVPGCVIDDLARNFYERLDETRVFLSVSSSTTYLESMAADRPTVILQDKRLFAADPGAEAEFAKLERAGILHGSPESAAEHINKIYGDVTAWWRSPDVQKAKDDFVAKYARCAEDWAGEWINEFKRQIGK